MVPNTASSSTPQNRRVEIYLERGRGEGNIWAPPPAVTPATRPAVREEPGEVMK